MAPCCNDVVRHRHIATARLDLVTISLPRRDRNALLHERSVEGEVSILEALKGCVKAEMLEISHDCTVCEAIQHDNYALYASDTIADNLLEEARIKLEKLQAAASRLKGLEENIKTFRSQAVVVSSLRDSLRVILGNTRVNYTLGLHPGNGSCVVLIDGQGSHGNGVDANPANNTNEVQPQPHRQPHRQRAVNIIDSPVAQPISSQILAPDPVHQRSTAVSLAPARAEALAPASGQVPAGPSPPARASVLVNLVHTDDLLLPVDGHQTKPDGPLAGIWASEEERGSAMNIHKQTMGPYHPKANPLLFVHGVQYVPSPTTGQANDNCRMVIFSDLAPAVTIHDVLAKVRGGKILRAVKVGDTASVSFFEAREAHAYVDKVKSLAQPLQILDKAAQVALAGSASYPIDPVLAADVLRGNTRVLAIRNFKKDNVSFFLAALNIWGQVEDYYFKEAKKIQSEKKASRRKNPRPVSSGDVEEWAHFMADWPVQDYEEADEEGAAATAHNDDDADDEAEDVHTLYLCFRDIAYATAAHRQIMNTQRFATYQHLEFASDPCAGSLQELGI